MLRRRGDGGLRPFRLALILTLFAAGCGGQEAAGVYFLRAGTNGTTQIFLQSFNGDTAQQLTGVGDPAAPEVIDYAIAPDGESIVYAAQNGADSALRRVETSGRNDVELIACPEAECAGPVWSPDGRRLVYERRPWDGTVFGSPRLHWLDTATGETVPLIEGNETPGYGARFSPDGAWLSYVSLADDGVVLYRLADGAQRLLSSRVGSPVAWSPDGAVVVYGDLVVQGHETAPPVGEGEAGGQLPIQESSNTFLYRTLVGADNPRERLSPDAAVADSAPAYSPDGKWIAFGRAPANTAAGRQLWLMRPDGREARALTANPAVTHGPPAWSPDGRYLLFQRFDPASGSPSVWRLEVATGEEMMVAEEAYLPGWAK